MLQNRTQKALSALFVTCGIAFGCAVSLGLLNASLEQLTLMWFAVIRGLFWRPQYVGFAFAGILIGVIQVSVVQYFGAMWEQAPINSPARVELEPAGLRSDVAPAVEVPRTHEKRFLASTEDAVVAVDMDRGEVLHVVDSGEFVIIDIALTPDHSLYAIGSGHLWEHRPQSGWVRHIPVSGNGLCADADGKLYATSVDRVVQIDPARGYETDVLHTLHLPSSGDCVVFEHRPLITVRNGPDDFLLRSRHHDMAALVDGLQSVGGVWGLADAGSGLLFGVTSRGEVLQVEPSSGRTSIVRTFRGYEFTGAASRPRARGVERR